MSRPKPFDVHPFSKDQLTGLLSSNSEASVEVIGGKSHTAYLAGYLRDLGANTILSEYVYTDQAFLEDYAGYYVRCFHAYRSRCTRLHFFQLEFKQQAISRVLSGHLDSLFAKKLRDSYLGFIVVRPLPYTIIGRTCLQAYPLENRRHFLIMDEYPVNLFGIKLTVKRTLPFQEQDSVTAACATSALWSAFQKTGRLFPHHMPSPVEITKSATMRFRVDERDFPSHGLTLSQMAHAIIGVGLDPLPVKLKDEYSSKLLLQSTVYAYLQGGLPVLLIADMFDCTLPMKPKCKGPHAVTITGYNMGDDPPTPYGPTKFLLRASRIDKFYAHDDGVGPFARMELKSPPVWQSSGKPTLSTSWANEDGDMGYFWAEGSVLLIPLYHKIRISFSAVFALLSHFDEFIEELRKRKGLPLTQRLEWDIRLSQVNDLKGEFATSNDVTDHDRRTILLTSLPRFVWCATARSEDRKIMDLLFDATDIEQGSFFLRAIEYNPDVSHVLRAVAQDESQVDRPRTDVLWRILGWFGE